MILMLGYRRPHLSSPRIDNADRWLSHGAFDLCCHPIPGMLGNGPIHQSADTLAINTSLFSQTRTASNSRLK